MTTTVRQSILIVEELVNAAFGCVILLSLRSIFDFCSLPGDDFHALFELIYQETFALTMARSTYIYFARA